MTESSAYYLQGWMFPLKNEGRGRYTIVKGDDLVAQRIRMILTTNPGERLDIPEFGAGLDRFLFSSNTPTTHGQIIYKIKDALAKWEPELEVKAIDLRASTDNPELIVIHIHYLSPYSGEDQFLDYDYRFMEVKHYDA